MKQNKTIQKIIAVILTIGVLLFFYNISSNWHYHKLPNGVIIVHAHPYVTQNNTSGNIPMNTHHHTASQYAFFAGIMSTMVLLLLILIIKKQQQFLIKSYNNFHSIVDNRFIQQCFDLRAPPLTI